MNNAGHELLRILREISKMVQENYHGRLEGSICSYVDLHLMWSTPLPGEEPLGPEIKRLLQELWVNWPEYSGNIIFPVPAPAGEQPGEYFLRSSSLNRHNVSRWQGEYGESRISLLNFLISELEGRQ